MCYSSAVCALVSQGCWWTLTPVTNLDTSVQIVSPLHPQLQSLHFPYNYCAACTVARLLVGF